MANHSNQFYSATHAHAPPSTSNSLDEQRRMEEIKAAARAFALSSTTNSSRRKGRKDKKGAAAALAGIHALNAYTSASAASNGKGMISRPYAQRGRPLAPVVLPTTTRTIVPPPPPRPHAHRGQSLVPSLESYPQSTKTLPLPSSYDAYAALTVSTRSTSNSPSDSSNDTELDEDEDKDFDDYELFVKSLGWNDDWMKLMDTSTSVAGEGDENDDDEEEEFQLDDVEDEEEEDDDDSSTRREGQSTAASGCDDKSVQPESPSETFVSANTSVAGAELDLLEDWEKDFYQELEEELGWLEEEDMEAAVATLLENQPKRIEPDEKLGGALKPTGDTTEPDEKEKELHFARASASRTKLTRTQYNQLQELLQKHYQLLLQQAALVTRTAHFQRLARDGKVVPSTAPIQGSETLDDLAEILDGAVGMLQDLDQNRKDAIRHHIQFSDTNQNVPPTRSRRSSWADAATPSATAMLSPGERRLTRSQFSKTLNERDRGKGLTVFAIPGINKLNETFSFVDKSVDGLKNGNILEVPSHAAACEQLLQYAGAIYTREFIPGEKDLSDHFIDPKDYLGDDFEPPCNERQEAMLRRDRNMFTSGEDNLVLRGVNLYGEKQWLLIADRFLPDRSTNIVSQRYSKICVLLYKAHGVKIDDFGNLEPPPQLESLDDVDKAKLAQTKRVDPPAILNVHRWSLEEDLSLLKAVPIMGHMWAEIAARVLPHRDRGHIRKRYQVLERRVKASVQRSNKIIVNIKNAHLNSPKKTSPTTKVLNPSPKQPPPSQSPSRKALTSQAPKPKQSCMPASRPITATAAPNGPIGRSDLRAINKSVGASSSCSGTGAISDAAAILASARKVPILPTTTHPRVTIMKTYVPAPPTRVNNSTVLHLAPSQTRTPVPAAVPPATKICSTPTRKDLHAHPVSTHLRQATTPKLSPPSLHLPTDEGSRAAFEKLAGDGSPGWSEMARIKTLERGDCDEIGSITTADTTVTQPAKSPKRPCEKNDSPGNFFAQMNMDDDPSGFSVLHSEIGQSFDKATNEADHDCDFQQRSKQSVSFLAGVLERSRQGQSATKPFTGGFLQVKQRTRSAAQADHPSRPSDRRLLTSYNETRPACTLPSAYPRSAPASEHNADSFSLPPIFSPTPPENNSSLGSFPSLHSPPVMSGGEIWNSLPVHDGKSSHQVLPSMSNPQATCATTENLAGAGHSSMGWSENSPPSLTPTSKNSNSTRQCLFGDGATLMDLDLEAISTLNSLSHSPAGDVFKKQEKRPVDGAKSLFAKVVGEAASTAPSSKKRRLHF